jgi:hypothetical protein
VASDLLFKLTCFHGMRHLSGCEVSKNTERIMHRNSFAKVICRSFLLAPSGVRTQVIDLKGCRALCGRPSPPDGPSSSGEFGPHWEPLRFILGLRQEIVAALCASVVRNTPTGPSELGTFWFAERNYRSRTVSVYGLNCDDLRAYALSGQCSKLNLRGESGGSQIENDPRNSDAGRVLFLGPCARRAARRRAIRSGTEPAARAAGRARAGRTEWSARAWFSWTWPERGF